jgi:hypothetical protein
MRVIGIGRSDENTTLFSEKVLRKKPVSGDEVYDGHALVPYSEERSGARTPQSVTHGTPIAGTDRRRHISPQSGKALEVLGHAIEYVADEYALSVADSASQPGNDPQVQAMQILMAANRNVYYTCPIASTLGERFRNFWRFRGTAATRHSDIEVYNPK